MSLIDRLEMRVAVIQAPMAGTSTPALAAAVSEAGGLGCLGLGAMRAEEASTAMAETRALTARPFGVNLFCHRPESSDPAREAAWLARLGAAPSGLRHEAEVEATLDALAAHLATHLDLDALLRLSA